MITSCKNSNLTYHVSVDSCNTKNARVKDSTKSVNPNSINSIKNIKVYLETSASMKGYINRPKIEDSGYIIKEIISYLITNITSNYSEPELFTISISPVEHTNGKATFISSLNNGTIFTGGSTHIHTIFDYILRNNSEGGISILISDCILDIGNNNANKGIVKNYIYSLLNREKTSALLFQYYSEFNGNWYYNRNSSEQPFLGHGITMHKRPLYLWIFGNPRNLSDLLKRHILKNYNHSFIYGINLSESPYLKLIQNTGKGKLYISENNDFTLIDYTQGDTANFVLGIDLSNFPDYMQDSSYLCRNLRLDNTYLKKKMQFTIYKKNNFVKNKIEQFDKPDMIVGALSKFTHVIDITISNLSSVADTSFNISLVVNEPTWIKQATISDDMGKTAKELEGKTYSFNTITSAFKDKFLRDNKCIFKINFKKIK